MCVCVCVYVCVCVCGWVGGWVWVCGCACVCVCGTAAKYIGHNTVVANCGIYFLRQPFMCRFLPLDQVQLVNMMCLFEL